MSKTFEEWWATHWEVKFARRKKEDRQLLKDIAREGWLAGRNKLRDQFRNLFGI